MPEDQTPSTPTPASSPSPEPNTTPAPSLVPEPVTTATTDDPQQPTQAAPVFASGPSKKKRTIIIGAIIAAALVVLGGGGALAYNLWYQNPDKVVSDAIVNALTAKTISATGLVEIENDDYTIKIEASGRNTVKADATVEIKLDYSSKDVSYSVNGEGIFSAAGDLYVKLNDAKKLAKSIEQQSDGEVSFEVFDGIINKIDGNWIKISKTDLGDVSEDYEKSQQCVADLSKKLESNADFRKKAEDDAAKLYKENKFIVVDKKLGARTINGQGSLGYQLSGDAEAADTFFTAMGETEFGKSVKECNKDIDFAQIISDDMKKDDAAAGTSEVQLWVSRFGHTITEISLTGEEEGTKGRIVFNPTFNKDEAIAIPTDVIKFSELRADIEKAYEDYYQSYYDAYYQETDSGAVGTGETLFN